MSIMCYMTCKGSTIACRPRPRGKTRAPLGGGEKLESSSSYSSPTGLYGSMSYCTIRYNTFCYAIS